MYTEIPGSYAAASNQSICAAPRRGGARTLTNVSSSLATQNVYVFPKTFIKLMCANLTGARKTTLMNVFDWLKRNSGYTHCKSSIPGFIPFYYDVKRTSNYE